MSVISQLSVERKLTTVRRGADNADKRPSSPKQIWYQLEPTPVFSRIAPFGPHDPIRKGTAARVCERAGDVGVKLRLR